MEGETIQKGGETFAQEAISNKRLDDGLGVVGPSLLPVLGNLHNALPARVFRRFDAADGLLALAHPRVNVHVLEAHEEGSVRGDVEPGVNLPEEVKRNDEG